MLVEAALWRKDGEVIANGPPGRVHFGRFTGHLEDVGRSDTSTSRSIEGEREELRTKAGSQCM